MNFENLSKTIHFRNSSKKMNFCNLSKKIEFGNLSKKWILKMYPNNLILEIYQKNWILEIYQKNMILEIYRNKILILAIYQENLNPALIIVGSIEKRFDQLRACHLVAQSVRWTKHVRHYSAKICGKIEKDENVNREILKTREELVCTKRVQLVSRQAKPARYICGECRRERDRVELTTPGSRRGLRDENSNGKPRWTKIESGRTVVATTQSDCI